MEKITKIDDKGIDLITEFEGLKLEAYKCSAGVPTIGWGNTYYEDGTKVKIGDKITLERAKELFKFILTNYEKAVDTFCVDTITQNQFNALVSFAYNCGTQNLKVSTLLKKVNINPNDPSINLEFAKWNKAGGKVLNGLTKRRSAEAALYFSK